MATRTTIIWEEFLAAGEEGQRWEWVDGEVEFTYQQSGVIQAWFDLERRLVELIHPDRPLQYDDQNQVLTIDIVPSFSIDLKDLFSI